MSYLRIGVAVSRLIDWLLLELTSSLLEDLFMDAGTDFTRDILVPDLNGEVGLLDVERNSANIIRNSLSKSVAIFTCHY